MNLRTAAAVLKFVSAFSFVFFFHFTGLRLWAGETDLTLNKLAVFGNSDEKPVITFNQSRNYYKQAFYLSLSTTPASTIIYTNDCSIPTMENGTVVYRTHFN